MKPTDTLDLCASQEAWIDDPRGEESGGEIIYEFKSQAEIAHEQTN